MNGVLCAKGKGIVGGAPSKFPLEITHPCDSLKARKRRGRGGFTVVLLWIGYVDQLCQDSLMQSVLTPNRGEKILVITLCG